MTKRRLPKLTPGRWGALTALLLLGLYTLAGFVLVPWWASEYGPRWLEENLGWQAGVEDIALNPFTLQLEVTGLRAEDAPARQVAGLDRLRLNLGFWPLLGGQVHLQQLHLQGPFVRLDLLPEGQLNLARDWLESHPPGKPEPESETETVRTEASAPQPPGLPVRLGELRIDDAHVLLRDQRTAQGYIHRFGPLGLTLNDLALLPGDNPASRYELTASLGAGARLSWQGSLRTWPLASEGNLTLEGLSRELLGHFLTPYLPYDWEKGRLGLAADYRLTLGETTRLAIQGGQAHLEEAGFRIADDPLLAFDSLRLEGIRFDLAQRQLQVGDIRLGDWTLHLARDAGGRLALMQPLQSAPESGSESSPAQGSQADSDSGIQWSVQHIGLENGQIHWRDQATAEPAELTVNARLLDLGGLSHRLDQPVDYRLALDFPTGGEFTSEGALTPAPFTLEASLDLARLALKPLQPYARPALAGELTDGTADFRGSLSLDNQTPQLTGTLSGVGRIQNLAVLAPGDEKTTAGWQSLTLDPLRITLDPLAIDIPRLDLYKPRLSLRRTDSGINLARLTAGDGAEAQTTGPDPATTVDDTPGPILRIDKLVLREGQVDFRDQTFQPAFEERIHAIEAQLTGLTNQPPQQGEARLTARLGDYGTLEADGTLGALTADGQHALKFTAGNIEMPALSPYLARYLGYPVRKGKLAVNLDYRLDGPRLDASNHLRFDAFYLGEPSGSGQAVSAPVKLGLALLRDSQEVIVLDLPISGDLSDPDFTLSRVLWRAFTNVLVKAASAPFNLLTGLTDLAGITGDQLQQVRFPAGSARLTEAEARELEALARALADKPSLAVAIPGAASPAVDGPALVHDRILKSLPEGADLEARIDLLETRLAEVAGSDRLESLRQGRDPSPEGWEGQLLDALAAAQPLAKDAPALTALAQARGQQVQDFLREKGIESARLYRVQETLDAEGSEGTVPMTLRLEAR